MPAPYITPVALSVPFDNSSNGFTSATVQGAIEELKNSATTTASPGFSFGRSGVSGSGTYLQNETVPSNISGRWVYLHGASIAQVYISNELITTYTMEVLYHDGNGINTVSLGTVTVNSSRGSSFTVSWPVPINKQLAVRVATSSANSPKNIVCGLQLLGSI